MKTQLNCHAYCVYGHRVQVCTDCIVTHEQLKFVPTYEFCKDTMCPLALDRQFNWTVCQECKSEKVVYDCIAAKFERLSKTVMGQLLNDCYDKKRE